MRRAGRGPRCGRRLGRRRCDPPRRECCFCSRTRDTSSTTGRSGPRRPPCHPAFAPCTQVAAGTPRGRRRRWHVTGGGSGRLSSGARFVTPYIQGNCSPFMAFGSVFRASASGFSPAARGSFHRARPQLEANHALSRALRKQVSCSGMKTGPILRAPIMARAPFRRGSSHRCFSCIAGARRDGTKNSGRWRGDPSPSLLPARGSPRS